MVIDPVNKNSFFLEFKNFWDKFFITSLSLGYTPKKAVSGQIFNTERRLASFFNLDKSISF